MNIQKYTYLSKYEDISYIYEKFENVKKFIDNNSSNSIMTNLNKFITLFYNDFKFDIYEQRFIISCLFEYDYFQKIILTKVNNNNYKKTIVQKVIENLNELANYSNIIEQSTILCNFKENNPKDLNHNYNIIKKIIKTKKTNFNYCFLFDNIKYFKNDKNKLNNYINFVNDILNEYLDSKTYY